MTTNPNPNLQLRGSGWTFSQTPTQEWEWVCMDPEGNVAARSTRTFKTLMECVQDATKHGYLPDRVDC
jgi:hypothetical protein